MPRTSVISAFINDNASGGGGAGPDGTQYYVELTVQSSQISSDLTNFPVYVDLSTMPADFFANVQSDGGDIRVTEDDGSTRCAVDLVSIDTDGSTGELHFLASSLSSSSDTTFRIYYGTTGTTSAPAVGSTYGRNAVWTDYSVVYHLNDDPSGATTVDSAGNANGTIGDAPTSVTGVLGSGYDFDGSNDYISSPSSVTGLDGTTDFTIQAWIYFDEVSSRQFLVTDRYTNNSNYFQARLENSDLGLEGGNYSSLAATGLSAATWHLFHAIHGANDEVYIDGSVADSAVGGATFSSDNNDLSWATRLNTGPTTGMAGALDEIRVSTTVSRDSDWIAAEYTNQNTPGTFYTVGSQTTV